MKCTKGLVKYCHKTSYCDRQPRRIEIAVVAQHHPMVAFVDMHIHSSALLNDGSNQENIRIIRDALLLRTIQFKCVNWKSLHTEHVQHLYLLSSEGFVLAEEILRPSIPSGADICDPRSILVPEFATLEIFHQAYLNRQVVARSMAVLFFRLNDWLLQTAVKLLDCELA